MLELFVYAAPGGDFLHTRKGGIFVIVAHPIDLFLNHLSASNSIFIEINVVMHHPFLIREGYLV